MQFFSRRAPRPLLRLFCLTLCCLLTAPQLALLPGRASGAPPARRSLMKNEAAWRPGELLVRFRRGVLEREIESLAATLGLTRAGRLRGASGVERLRAADGRNVDDILASLRASESVEFAEPNYVISADQLAPDDPLFNEQWALRDAAGADGAAGAGVNAARAWRHTTGSPDTVIAVIDSGIDFSHPDLKDNRWVNMREAVGGRDDDGNGYADDLQGWDWVTNSGGGKDESGHGTAVAGIIAAAGDNGEGGSGVMWRAGLMSLRVLDREGRGSVADAVEAIDYAVAHRARVINFSWGLDEPSAALRQAVERALLSSVTVVCAAGNGGRNVNVSPRFPAGYNNPSLLSVAGTTRGDELASWSNWGPGRVSLAAPGEGVLTTKAGGGYEAVSGTSAAAALVSGVAGLVRTLRPRLSAARTREVIERGSRRAAALNDKVRGGVLDAGGALDSLGILREDEGVGGDEDESTGADKDRDESRATHPAAPAALDRGLGGAAPAPPIMEAPAPNLPNLEELRRHRPGSPQAIPPVPSTRRRCPPQNPRCNEEGDGAPRPAPTPASGRGHAWLDGPSGVSLASIAERSLFVALTAAMNGGRPVLDIPLLDYFSGGGGHSVSDAQPASASLPRLYSPAAAPLVQAPPAALVAHWKFDEGTGVTASDSTAGGNTGTLQNGAAWAAGKLGTAASFDGADDYVQVGARAGLVMTSAATFAAWLHPTGAGSGGWMGGIIVNKEGEYEIARFPDGTIQWAFANSNPGWAWINTGAVAPLNQWTHVAVTYDNGVVKTYLNGQLTHIHNGAGAIGDAITGQDDFRIGGRQVISQHFHGRIDDVKVYGGALTAQEVAALAAPAGQLMAHWKFDEASGTTAADSTGGGNTGTLQNGAPWATGKVGSAVGFDGSDDYVQVGARPALQMTSAATFSAWLHPTGAGSGGWMGGIIVNKEGEYEIARFPDGTIQWAFANSNPGWNWVNTGVVAPLNQWTHVAVTYDGGVIKTYANGQLAHTFSGAGAIGDAITGQDDFRIGGRQVISQHFQGRIDDVKVYKSALTAQEVTALTSLGGDGLTGMYFDNDDLTAYKLTRTDPAVSFDWGAGSPDASVGVDTFSARWTGTVVPRFTETYTFHTTSDDGVRLWVDGQLLVDRWVDQAPTEWSGQMALEAGRAYAVRMEYFERLGGAAATLAWSSARQAKEVIPQSQLSSCWKGADQFVRDFYQGALARQPSAGELQTWAGRLGSALDYHSLIAEARALGVTLFGSQEYAGRGRDDSGYVFDLYWAYLQRAPDQSGWNFWTGVVASSGRPAVRDAFPASGEFQEKLKSLCGSAASDPAAGGAGYNFEAAMLDPLNRTGGAGVDPYSRNFNWSLPLLSLRGRAGLDLGLTLSYNSLVWTKDNTGIAFDVERGFPSPGFRLGFPSVMPKFYNPQIQQAGQPTRYSYLLLTGAGERVELRQVGTSNVYESADSSYLQLTDNGSWLSLVSADGTALSLTMRDGQFRCHEVKDRNGNYITVGYDAYGQISSITDALGRVVTFVYDAFQNLTEIRQEWKRETETGSVTETHKWATFGYADLTLQPSFSNLAVIGAQPGAVIPVVAWVSIGDGSYHRFYYTAWGQVWKVTHFAADSVVNGSPQDTHPLSSTRVNLPGSELLGISPQTDCPRFTQQRVWIENGVMNQSAEVTTGYDPWSPNASSCEVTEPDDTRHKHFYGADWKRGLTTRSEVWSGGQLKKWTTFELTHDGPAGAAYPTNPRVAETNVYDFEGRRRRTAVSYTSFGLPQEVIEYKADAVNPLRTTRTEYDLRTQLTSRRILGLRSLVKVYAGAAVDANLRSKVEYVYDDDTLAGFLQGLPGTAVSHRWEMYDTTYRWRGNLNRVRRYEVNQQTGVESGAFTENKLGYHVTGTLAFTRDALEHQTSTGYTDAFFDGISRNTFAYPTAVTDPDGYTSFTWYNYDMGLVTKMQTPLPNQTANVPGPAQRSLYDAAGRLKKTINTANDARTEWEYPLSNTAVKTFTTIEDASLTDPNRRAYSATVLDGAGRVRATSRDLPNSAGGFAGQLFYFDTMGRTVRTYNPAETDADWNVAGEDAAAGWVFTGQTYDWNGRPKITTNTDQTTREVSYEGCGCAGGDVVTTDGEPVMLPPPAGSSTFSTGRRRRKEYHDVLGRRVKVEIINREGTPYQSTVTEYDAHDRVTAVKEYKGAALEDGSCPLDTCQVTTMSYDGYGRLQSRRLPQQSLPTTYTYNADDTLHQKADGRGATQTHTYNNNRHLVNSIGHAAPHPIPVPPTVTYTYDAAGNRKTQTDQAGSASYQYDSLGRLTEERRQFNSLGGSYPLNYTYNLADQVASITDPFGQRVDYTYDKSGSLSAVGGTPYGGVTQYASGMKYRAWGALRESDLGNGLKVSLGYDTRLLPRRYHVRVPGAPAGTADRALSDYEYEADGRVKTMLDRTDPAFDRSYGYDLVGRLASANTTGSAAFFQSYAYDEFGNMTFRGNGSWRFFETTGSDYRNNRNIKTITSPPSFPSCCPPQPVFWTYDADGNVTRDHNKEYTYDAAGNKVKVFENHQPAGGFSRQLWLSQDYDAEGLPAKRVEQLSVGGGASSFDFTYYVRSSVIDDLVVTELNQGGAKKRTFVYANGAALALQQNNQVRWLHDDPVTKGRRHTAPDGTLAAREEVDPLGNEVPLTDPQPPEMTPDYLYTGNYESSGNPYDTPSGCMADGQPMSCSYVMMLLRFGSGVGRDGGSLRVLYHNDWRGTESQLSAHGFMAINVPGSQVKQSVPFDVPGIRDLLKDTVTKPDCEKFLKDLSKALNKNNKKNPVTRGGDMMRLFEGVLNSANGGLTRQKTAGSFGHGGADGNIDKGTAVLYPGAGIAGASAQTQLVHDTMGVLNELPHLAGTKYLYSDKDLAQAAFDVTGLQDIQYGAGKSIPFPGNKNFNLHKAAMKDVNHPSWVNYFHNLLRQKCPVTEKK